MIDKFGRKISSLRLSVTQRCNLNCEYCHKEGEKTTDSEISIENIKEILETASELGIKKIKITGGEPLLRDDIVEIIRTIKKHNFDDISLTTNGFLLDKLAKRLKQAGLNRVNIGCDSVSFLAKNKKSIEQGLKAAKEADLNPIKLNMVVLKGINDHEIEDMIEFARENDSILQLIELVKVNNEFYNKHFLSLDSIEKELNERANRVIKRKTQCRMQYDLGNVIVEVVRPLHKNFCKNCNKLRITSDGKIKPCLMTDELVEFNGKDSFVEAVGKRTIYNQ